MKHQKKRLAELRQDYESMKKLFLFAAKETKNAEKKEKFERSAKICEGMKEVCETLFIASDEILAER